MPIHVLIVDSNEITRAGIKTTFSLRPDLKLVGAAASLDEGLSIANETRIDVAIIDPSVVPDDSLDAVRRFRQAYPSLKLLVFSSEDCADFAQSITAAGASGYLIKAASVDEIAVAIRSVYVGRVFISHTHQAMTTPKQTRRSSPVRSSENVSQVGEGHQLSKREREVLTLLTDGMTNKQVAEELFLSVKTVETYRSRIMRKHGLRGRSELVSFARQTLPLAV